MEDMAKQQKLSDDDNVVYVPIEDIRIIERLLHDWELVKQEYHKMDANRKNAE